jgi:disulfide bond formation protein DsbB
VKQVAKKKVAFKLKPYMMAVLVLMMAIGAIVGAWYIEIFLEIKPCKLCLEQRYSSYACRLSGNSLFYILNQWA